jgi:hypothetical protein
VQILRRHFKNSKIFCDTDRSFTLDAMKLRQTPRWDNIQFTKAPNVLRGMGLTHLAKNEKAKKELAEKGMGLE